MTKRKAICKKCNEAIDSGQCPQLLQPLSSLDTQGFLSRKWQLLCLIGHAVESKLVVEILIFSLTGRALLWKALCRVQRMIQSPLASISCCNGEVGGGNPWPADRQMHLIWINKSHILIISSSDLEILAFNWPKVAEGIDKKGTSHGKCKS